MIDTATNTRRFERKLAKKDRRIVAMEKRITQLERALAQKAMDSARFHRDTISAVQEALCNVRMIPVIGLGKTQKVVEVRVAEDK